MMLSAKRIRAEHLYYAAFAIFSFQYILSYTLFENLFGMPVDTVCSFLKIAAFVLLFVKMLLQVYAERLIVPFLLLGLIAVMSLYFTFDQHLIVTIAFAASSQGITLSKVAKVNFAVTSLMLVITIACALSGAVESSTHFSSSGYQATSLGFTVPNRLGGFILSACVSLAIMHYPSIRSRDLFLFVVAVVVCGFVAGSSTAVLGILVTVLMLSIFSSCERRGVMKTLIAACVALLVFLIFSSIYFMVFFNPSNWAHAALDDLFTGRLELAHRYFALFPPTAFGRDFSSMEFVVGNYETLVVDNAYAKLFIQVGYIPAAVFLALYIGPFVRSLRGCPCNFACLYGLIVMGVVAFAESYAFHFVMNIAMLCLLSPFFKYRRVAVGRTNLSSEFTRDGGWA